MDFFRDDIILEMTSETVETANFKKNFFFVYTFFVDTKKQQAKLDENMTTYKVWEHINKLSSKQCIRLHKTFFSCAKCEPLRTPPSHGHLYMCWSPRAHFSSCLTVEQNHPSLVGLWDEISWTLHLYFQGTKVTYERYQI